MFYHCDTLSAIQTKINKRKMDEVFVWTKIDDFFFLFSLPELMPRTCTLLGSSGGVNVGAGWWSSERFH